MPGAELETVVVQWRPASCSAADMVARLREADVPVVARVRDDAICFDLRTTREGDIETLVESVASMVGGDGDEGEDESSVASLPVIQS